MFDLFLLFLALVGLFAIIVFVVAKVKKVALDKSLSIVWQWVRENLHDDSGLLSFQLYEDGFQKVLDIIARHSRISKENTFCQNQGSHVWFQMLPVNDQSLAAAGQEAKIFIRNLATVAGYTDIDIETWDAPGADGTLILHIGMATTDAQKSELTAMRQNRARLEVLQAAADVKPFEDEELNKDMEGNGDGKVAGNAGI